MAVGQDGRNEVMLKKFRGSKTISTGPVLLDHRSIPSVPFHS